MDKKKYVPLDLTHTQKERILEMVAAIYPTAIKAWFNTNGRIQVLLDKDEEEDVIWDWFEFIIYAVPAYIVTDVYLAFVHRMRMVEYLDPYKQYPGAPAFLHPVEYIYPLFKHIQSKKK